MTEYWTYGVSIPGLVVPAAKQAEAEGWDGVVFVDSQNLRLDCYVVMAIATTVTTRLKVSPGVTNPYTRHAAAAAGAIASIQAESGGRASFGIGRGDSALAYLGLAPAPVDTFEKYVVDLQGFLSGKEVPFEASGSAVADASTLHLADRPSASSIKWLDPTVAKVPVEVVGTGPKVIAVGGRHADIVTFTVGADLDRLRWAIETARAAAADADRTAASLQFGAYLNVVCHPDRALARKLVSGGLASFSRFSAMHGSPVGPVSQESGGVLQNIQASYDMTRHGRSDTSQTAVMTDDFIDQFSIAGSPEYCVDRIAEIADLGVDRIVITPPNRGIEEQYPAETIEANRYMVEEMLPKLALSADGDHQ